MMALESGEDADMKNATIDLVNSCTFGKIKAEELRYLMLSICS